MKLSSEFRRGRSLQDGSNFRFGISDPRLDGGHGIMSASAPGMAAANSPGGKPSASHRAVGLECFQRVFRAAWLKTALGGGAEEESFGRRQGQLVNADEQNKWVRKGGGQKAEGRKRSKGGRTRLLRFVHSAFFLLHLDNSPALRSVVKKSFSTPSNALPTMDARATSTKSMGSEKSC